MDQKLTYLDFEDAYKKAFEFIKSTQTTQHLPLLEALGKVIAKDIKASKNLPSFDNSAMDGFAFKYENKGKTLKIKERILAGAKIENICHNLKDDECYKIMTGAIVPNCVDTIVPIENCKDVTTSSVTIPEEIKKGANLRVQGEELKEGEILLKKGTTITSAAITLLASQGICVVEVLKDLQIVVLSTGDELKEPWESANTQEIYNCNSYAIVSLLKENGFDATYGGVIGDNLEKTKEYIKELKKYDVIITSGGVSLGEADFVAEAFLQNGLNPLFHGVNIKPGKPIMIGQMAETLVVSLPGNPLTAMVNAHLFLLPILKKLQGFNEFYKDTVVAVNQKEFKVKQGRVNVVLGHYKDGKFCATKDNKYGSGSITSLYESNALVLTNETTSSCEQNQTIKVVTFNSNYVDAKLDILN